MPVLVRRPLARKLRRRGDQDRVEEGRARYFSPLRPAQRHRRGAAFIECNLGVRSMAINLKHPTGARLIRELAGKSDAVLQNFRPRVLDKLGLGDDDLRKANPKLVIVKLPGFGSEGPKSSYGTWGSTYGVFRNDLSLESSRAGSPDRQPGCVSRSFGFCHGANAACRGYCSIAGAPARA